MRDKLLILGVCLLLITPAVVATSDERTETKAYVASSFFILNPEAIVEYFAGEGTGDELPGVGGNLFKVQGGETAVTITVEDASGQDIRASYNFEDSNGDDISHGWFCNSVSLTIPSNAAGMWVGVSGFPLNCPNPGVATAGNITATFS